MQAKREPIAAPVDLVASHLRMPPGGFATSIVVETNFGKLRRITGAAGGSPAEPAAHTLPQGRFLDGLLQFLGLHDPLSEIDMGPRPTIIPGS
jgi:hypothetical protein